jgi:hypothetical protein
MGAYTIRRVALEDGEARAAVRYVVVHRDAVLRELIERAAGVGALGLDGAVGVAAVIAEGDVVRAGARETAALDALGLVVARATRRDASAQFTGA